jgi:hypothetical protein
MGDAPYKKSVKLGLSGEAVMIGGLCATNRGVAQCVLGTVPEPRVSPIDDVFRYARLARVIDDSAAPIETAPFAAREPTF